jgi:hypothetical protein
LDTNEFADTEFSVMNYFPLNPLFFKIKPKFYCLVDPAFFKKTVEYERVMELYKIINEKVDWYIQLYIPSWELKKFMDFCRLDNPHIHVVTVNWSQIHNVSDSLYFRLLKGNYVGLNLHLSVVQLCIYTALNNGFDELRLYGVDHTHICSLTMDDQNRLCSKKTYFYDREPEFRPIIKNVDGLNYKVSEFLINNGYLFLLHELLDRYAKSLGARIINCTPGSMIDAYERIDF